MTEQRQSVNHLAALGAGATLLALILPMVARAIFPEAGGFGFFLAGVLSECGLLAVGVLLVMRAGLPRERLVQGACVLLVLALAVSVYTAALQLRGDPLAWPVVAAAGASLLVMGLTLWPVGVSGDVWVVAAVAPVACMVLAAAPKAVSLEAWPAARLVVAVAALLGWLLVARPLPGRLQYGVCCAVLGAGAVFFTLWQPPPPKPVPIARHLASLEKELLDRLPGWKGEEQRLTPDVEGQVGADEYLNLELTPPTGNAHVRVYITYNANAMSNIPHVPWVCMTNAGYTLLSTRQDGVVISSMKGKEIQPNVLLFDGGPGRREGRTLMFQYFRVGESYTWSRQLARFMATTGSLGRGSFLSQTQVTLWPDPNDRGDPMDKGSRAYQMGLEILNCLVPLLEREYYPDLRSPEGG